MQRLRPVLMALSALAVIAAALFLSTGRSSRADADARVRVLIRSLADPDPDVRRDAESELRAMGFSAAGALREAEKSPDAARAGPAPRLLREIEPSPAPESPRP
jgi:hypothetical protein